MIELLVGVAGALVFIGLVAIVNKVLERRDRR